MSNGTDNSARRSRFAAAAVMLAWLVACVVVLVVFRGTPPRFRVYFAIFTLLGLIWSIGALRARFSR